MVKKPEIMKPEVGDEIKAKKVKKEKKSTKETGVAVENPPKKRRCMSLGDRLKAKATRNLLKGLVPEVEKEKTEEAAPDAPEEPAKENLDVYITGLPFDWAVDDIRELFSSAGTVLDVRAPTWHDTGRLRGNAHVTYADRQGVLNAIEKMHKYYVTSTRYITVEEANAKNTVAPSTGPITVPSGCRTLFVKNLPYDATEPEIANVLGGKSVLGVRVVTQYGRSKGFAYVDYRKTDDVIAACKLAEKGIKLKGRFIKVDCDTGAPKAGFHYRPESYETRLGSKKANIQKRTEKREATKEEKGEVKKTIKKK